VGDTGFRFDAPIPLVQRPATPAGARLGPVLHVSLLWFADSARPADVDAFIACAEQIASIPGISSHAIGTPAMVTWPEPDQSWTFAMILGFDDRAAMDDYQSHPIHLTAIEHSRKIVDHFYVFYVDLPAPFAG
jgi:hypothetical protein